MALSCENENKRKRKKDHEEEEETEQPPELFDRLSGIDVSQKEMEFRKLISDGRQVTGGEQVHEQRQTDHQRRFPRGD